VQIRTFDGRGWRAPDNRQSHSQTFGYGETHQLEVRAHATPTGWGPAAGPRGATTVPEPKNPEIYNVTFNSSNYIDFNIRDFPGNTSWTINFNHKGYSGSFTSSAKVNVGPAGNGYTWGGNYYVEAKGGELVITMTNPNHPAVTKTVRR